MEENLKKAIIEKTFTDREKTLLDKIKKREITEVEIVEIKRKARDQQKTIATSFKLSMKERERLAEIRDELKLPSISATAKVLFSFCFVNKNQLYQYVKELRNVQKKARSEQADS